MFILLFCGDCRDVCIGINNELHLRRNQHKVRRRFQPGEVGHPLEKIRSAAAIAGHACSLPLGFPLMTLGLYLRTTSVPGP